MRTLVRAPWKLVQDRNGGRELLFHLERDPGETRDVRAEHPEVAARLRAEMVALARRSAARRHAVPRRADEDLPARERALLEELGYIDAESAR